ncbi:MAG: hypothetical protein Q8934_22005 [Bacillota bacterium]|nr:hypothetical protein [Bacillota bacterium]
MLDFNADKMRRFINQDLLLKRVFDDFNKQMAEEKALEVVFNSYVLEDSVMEDLYNAL